jgi:hypothetical protein
MHKKISSFVPLMFFIILTISSVSAAFGGTIQYSLADLEGTWEGNSLASGPGAPWWERATITIASDGTFTGTTAESDGSSGPISAKFTISSEGIVRLEGSTDADFLCSMGSGKTAIVCTATWTTGSPGPTEMKIFTKKAASYSSADLTGKWNINALASGPGEPFWFRGIITIDADGSCSGTATFNDGSSDSFSGTCSISADGIVNLSFVNPSNRCTLDASKSVMACTSTWSSGSPGTTDMGIGTKKANLYSQADLTGTWNFNSLASGPGAPFWFRGIITVYANGSCSGTATFNDGSSDSFSGACSISPGGIVTLASTNSSNRCTMDAGKSVIACTSTWPKGSPGTTDMGIGLKSGPSIILTSPNGGEVIPSGSKYNITWGADTSMVKFTLKYSMDNGVTWQKIASDVIGTSYEWSVPVPANNKNLCLIQVIGYDGNTTKVGVAKSGTFSIDVLTITAPATGEVVLQNAPYTITWTANGTAATPDSVTVKYTLNNVTTWKTAQGTSAVDLSSFSWNVPAVSKTKNNAMVKVILKAAGVTVAKAVSNKFTVQ